jgi:hypothetical protein
MMKLLTAANRKALPPLYSQDGKGDEAIAFVKFFGAGRGTWYATEADATLNDGTVHALRDVQAFEVKHIKEINFFGFVVSPLGPDCDELGSFSLTELQAMRFFNGRLPIERDRHFTPTTIGSLRGVTE